jgi:hypothetical protein
MIEIVQFRNGKYGVRDLSRGNDCFHSMLSGTWWHQEASPTYWQGTYAKAKEVFEGLTDRGTPILPPKEVKKYNALWDRIWHKPSDPHSRLLEAQCDYWCELYFNEKARNNGH